MEHSERPAGGKGAVSMDELLREYDGLMGRGEWEKAEALLLLLRSAAEKKGDRRAELTFCSELLGFYRQRSIRAGFDAAWARSLALLDELDVEPVSRGTILINGATGLSSFGEAEAALPYYQEAYGCYLGRLAPEDERFAALFNNMAAAFQACGAWDRAEEHLRMALSVLEKHPHHLDVATTYVNLAQLCAARDPADGRAEDCLRRALERLDDPEAVWNDYYAHTCRKCAGAFGALGWRETEQDLRERAEMVYEGT